MVVYVLVAAVMLAFSVPTLGAAGSGWLASLDSRRVSVMLVAGTSTVAALPQATSLDCRRALRSAARCTPRPVVRCHALLAPRSILAPARVMYSCSNDLTTSSVGQGRYLLYEQLKGPPRYTEASVRRLAATRMSPRATVRISEFDRLSRATLLKAITTAPAGFWGALNKRLRIISTIYLDALPAHLPRLVTCARHAPPLRCSVVMQGQVLGSGSLIYQVERNVIPPIPKPVSIAAIFARVDAAENLAAFGRAPTVSERRLLVALSAPIQG
jgi:hypothetical protein